MSLELVAFFFIEYNYLKWYSYIYVFDQEMFDERCTTRREGLSNSS